MIRNNTNNSDKIDFSWLKIHSKSTSNDNKVNTNHVDSGPMLTMLEYYAAVSGFNMAPSFHKIYNENKPSFDYSYIERDAWNLDWDDTKRFFKVNFDNNDKDLVFWYWIKNKFFPMGWEGESVLKNIRSYLNSGKVDGAISIPLFSKLNGDHKFYHYKSNANNYRSNANNSAPPVRYNNLDGEYIDDGVLPLLGKIEWDWVLDKPKSEEENIELKNYIINLIKELLLNKKSLNEIVEVCDSITKSHKDNIAKVNLHDSLKEGAQKLLSMIDGLIEHTVFVVPGRFVFSEDQNKYIPISFPISVMVQLSFFLSDEDGVLISLTPLDTPKISQDNLRVDDSEDGNVDDKYFKGENNVGTVSLKEWNRFLNEGHGYEYLFEDGVLANNKEEFWNHFWEFTKNNIFSDLLKVEITSHFGFDSKIYFFNPQSSIDILYKNYKLAILNIKRQRGYTKEANRKLIKNKVELGDGCAFKKMLSSEFCDVEKNNYFSSGLEKVSFLNYESKLSKSTNKGLVDSFLNETKNGSNIRAGGLLKEQKINDKDHFGLNINQRLFCHHALDDEESFIALNGPPGTGKTTVLQALIASEVVRSACNNDRPKIIMGASATHQAKSNIIDGFKHEKIHHHNDKGIWRRWINGGVDDEGKIKDLDYGLELTSNKIVEERLGFIRDNNEELKKTWVEEFERSKNVPLCTKSQQSLILSLSNFIKNNEIKDVSNFKLENFIHEEPISFEEKIDVLYKTLKEFKSISNASEATIKEKIINFKDKITPVDNIYSSLRKTIKEIDDSVINKTNIKRKEDFYELIKVLKDEIEIKEKKEELDKCEKDIECIRILNLLNNEWNIIFDGFNDIFLPIPKAVWFLFYWLKSSKLKDIINFALKKSNSSLETGDYLIKKWKQSSKIRFDIYNKKLYEIKDNKIIIDRDDGFKDIVNSYFKKSKIVNSYSKLLSVEESISDILKDKCKQKKALEEELSVLEKKTEINIGHIEQAISSLEDIESCSKGSLKVLEELLNACPTEKEENKKGRDQSRVESLIKHVEDNKIKVFENLLAKDDSINLKSFFDIDFVIDDFSDILSSWLDNAYKPTCFHLASRWHEGCLIKEMAGTGINGSNFYAIQNKFKLLSRIYPIMVSTLHAIGNRTQVMKGEERRIGFGLVDWLIVDEAGQVPMDVGAIGLLVSKKCIAVGDIDQIQPVWGIEEDDDTSLFCGIANVSNKIFKDKNNSFGKTDWSCHTGSLLSLIQKYTPWKPYESLQRGLYLLEHNRCPIEIISYCDQLSYKNNLKYKITSCYYNDKPKYNNFLNKDTPSLKSKMSLELVQNRKINPNIPLNYPVSIIAHNGMDTMSKGSRYNDGEIIEILKWIDQNYNTLVKKGSNEEISIADRIAVITPFKIQATKIIEMAQKYSWKNEFLKDNVQKLFKKSQEDNNNIKSIVVGTVHSLQGAEIDIVLFSNVYSGRPKTIFQDRNPQIMNVAVSRSKEAFVMFCNREFFDYYKTQGTATSLLIEHYENLKKH